MSGRVPSAQPDIECAFAFPCGTIPVLQLTIHSPDALGSGVCLESGHEQLQSVQKECGCGTIIKWAGWYLVKGDDLEVFSSFNGSVIVFGCSLCPSRYSSDW